MLLTSLGSREMKSLWNWGSITCIIYLIWEGSQRSMSSSSANSFSGPLQRWGGCSRDVRHGATPGHPHRETTGFPESP
uniref:Uncharacterized protein n=1 Tax=Crocodylus porosus TaxID=8502 RepID=A0A7M4FIS2_CROPO